MDQLIETNHYEEVMDSALAPKVCVDPAGNIVNTKMYDAIG
jgi:hypothetical protein